MRTHDSSTNPKAPYVRPELVSYGDLRTLTKTKTGSGNDSVTHVSTKVPGS